MVVQPKNQQVSITRSDGQSFVEVGETWKEKRVARWQRTDLTIVVKCGSTAFILTSIERHNHWDIRALVVVPGTLAFIF